MADSFRVHKGAAAKELLQLSASPASPRSASSRLVAPAKLLLLRHCINAAQDITAVIHSGTGQDVVYVVALVTVVFLGTHMFRRGGERRLAVFEDLPWLHCGCCFLWLSLPLPLLLLLWRLNTLTLPVFMTQVIKLNGALQFLLPFICTGEGGREQSSFTLVVLVVVQ